MRESEESTDRPGHGPEAALAAPSAARATDGTATPENGTPADQTAPEPHGVREGARTPARPSSSRRSRRRVQTTDEIRLTFLGEDPKYTMAQLAEEAGVDINLARRFWRTQGFANVADDAVIFVSDDVEALRAWVEQIEAGVVDVETVMSFVRAQSYNMERLAQWQLEAAVDDYTEYRNFDDTAARIIFVDNLPELLPFMERQLSYAWRRQMVDLAERTMQELAARTEAPVAGETIPLPRALGFVDMISFTSEARRMNSRELVELVQGFEFTARDVISANGARVVKTVGDAVLYAADDVLTAARVALAMTEAITADPHLLPVRASLVWGRVISRSGDIFGPAVNLASRLVDIAPRGSVYMDEATGALLAKHPRAADFLQVPQPSVAVPGIGAITPIDLRWASEPDPNEIWLPNR